VGTVEAHAAGRESIDVRRLHHRVSVAAESRVQIIDRDQQHIGSISAREAAVHQTQGQDKEAEAGLQGRVELCGVGGIETRNEGPESSTKVITFPKAIETSVLAHDGIEARRFRTRNLGNLADDSRSKHFWEEPKSGT